MTQITLAETSEDDLNSFFIFQTDEEANYRAAFTQKDPNDKEAYIEKWTRLLKDPTISIRTVKADDKIIGSVGKWMLEDEPQITFWFDKSTWGKGFATAAVKKFLKIEKIRPLYGRAAFDNLASQKVMEKCGFIKVGKDSGFSNARQMEIEEFIFQLK